METLSKRKGLLPSMVKKSVNNFFDEFIAKGVSDGTDKNFVESNYEPSVNLKQTDTNIDVDLATPVIQKVDFSKNDSYTRREFNYRSFCRLPNL